MVLTIFLSGCTSTTETNPSKSIISSQGQNQEASPESNESITQITASPTKSSKTDDVVADEKNNAVDNSEVKKIGPFVVESIREISSLYSNLRDDFVTKDYDKMATDALLLERYTEKRIEEISIDEKIPREEIFGKLSSKDRIIFNKFNGYLLNMQQISDEVKTPLSYIKDDPSLVDVKDKIDKFAAAVRASHDANFKLEELMDACDEYEVDCGQSLSEKKVLEKSIEFL